jgi:hypothetical protein
MRDRGCSGQQGVEPAQELRKYCSGMGTTQDCMLTQTPTRGCGGMQSAGSEKVAELAELLQDIVPHAAAPERIFSTMEWQQNNTRNRLSAATQVLRVVKHLDGCQHGGCGR